MRATRRAVLSLALLVGSASADELPPATLEHLREAVARLRSAGDLTAEKAWTFELKGLAPEELEFAPDELPGLPGELREALRRVCRTAALRRGPLGQLGKARDICFLLASPSNEDWARASRLLRREPFSDELDRAVVALGKDGRAEVRLLAAQLASSLVVFGRGDEALMDTVRASLMDPHQNVVMASTFTALDTRDKRTIDHLVASVKDERALDPRAPPLLNMGTAMNLGERIQNHLSWTFWQERSARWKFEPPGFDAAGNPLPTNEPVYVLLSPDEIRAWWKENREAFGFGTPAPQWRCVFDDVLVVDVGKRLVVADADGRKLTIHLKVYREHWSGSEPLTTIDGEILGEVLGEESHVAGFGNPDHRDGYVSHERGTWGDGRTFGEVVCEAAFLPTERSGRVRMKLRMHIGHLGR